MMLDEFFSSSTPVAAWLYFIANSKPTHSLRAGGHLPHALEYTISMDFTRFAAAIHRTWINYQKSESAVAVAGGPFDFASILDEGGCLPASRCTVKYKCLSLGN